MRTKIRKRVIRISILKILMRMRNRNWQGTIDSLLSNRRVKMNKILRRRIKFKLRVMWK